MNEKKTGKEVQATILKNVLDYFDKDTTNVPQELYKEVFNYLYLPVQDTKPIEEGVVKLRSHINWLLSCAYPAHIASEYNRNVEVAAAMCKLFTEEIERLKQSVGIEGKDYKLQYQQKGVLTGEWFDCGKSHYDKTIHEKRVIRVPFSTQPDMEVFANWIIKEGWKHYEAGMWENGEDETIGTDGLVGLYNESKIKL